MTDDTQQPDPFSELRGLIEAAHLTPLPWKHGNPTGWIWCPSAKGGDRHVADIRGWGYFTGEGFGALGLSGDEALTHQRAVGDLICAAVNSLGALLDERDRLRAALQEIADQCPTYDGDFDEFATPSDFGNAEDYAHERWRMSEGSLGDTARQALSQEIG